MSEAPMPSVADPTRATDPATLELVALFSGPLAAVRFPDVDHATLSELVAALERAHAEVEQARASLEAAEAALEQRRVELAGRAQRAKAYARVYAEGDAALQAELDRITLPKPIARVAAAAPDAAAEPKRRGRPRKVREASTLFEVPGELPKTIEAPAAE